MPGDVKQQASQAITAAGYKPPAPVNPVDKSFKDCKAAASKAADVKHRLAQQEDKLEKLLTACEECVSKVDSLKEELVKADEEVSKLFKAHQDHIGPGSIAAVTAFRAEEHSPEATAALHELEALCKNHGIEASVHAEVNALFH